MNSVQASVDTVEDAKHQATLLNSVLQKETRAERRGRLRVILPEITPDFFIVLSKWADESASNNNAGIILCKDLLDLIEFNDLREDWNELERTLIWGSAQFMTRHEPLSLEIFGPDNADRTIDYMALRGALLSIYQFAQRDDMASLGLAILNVILETASRAVSGPPIVSRADELRFETLVIGARMIIWRRKHNFKADARRILDEAQAVFEGLTSKPMDQGTRINLDSSAAAMFGILGDLTLHDDNPEEAMRLHMTALQQHEALVKRARQEELAEEHVYTLSSSVSKSLWRLARAEIRLWHLDEACDHLERAIIEYRRLGVKGHELAECLQDQAKVEFLRTNFAHAVTLLDEAARLQQEGESE